MSCIKTKSITATAIFIFIFSLLSPSCIQSETVSRLVLNPQKTAQSITGFGASGAWWAQAIGGWPESERKRIVKLLYGESGIALSIYRYNTGAGSDSEINDPWRGAQTFEISPGKYDWSKDANAVRILREVCAEGAPRIVMFANSPPLRMTKSGSAFAKKEQQDKSNLRKDMYGAFAAYLVDITEHFIVDEKIPVHSISPINEPQWDWDDTSQEGCHYSPQETAEMVEILLKEIERRSVKVKVEAPENGSWERIGGAVDNWKESPVYLETLFGNPYIKKNLDGYAIHSYWADLESKKSFAKYFQKRYPDKELHMTEWCEMKGGRDFGMDSALKLANEIVDDMVDGGVSSWQLWIAVSKYNFRDGLIHVDEEQKKVLPTKRLWAMGNFSRFIRPGFTRFEVENNTLGLRMLACKNSDSSNLVVVVVNNNDQDVTVNLSRQNIGSNMRYDSFETSGESDLKHIRSKAVIVDYTFPPQCVTTLVFE
jgi:O-glycosyl hydrolase